jgi:hypothetical protein
MRITIDKTNEERQTPIVTIDTKSCKYPYAIRESIELALKLDGYSDNTIDEVFGRNQDCKKELTNEQRNKTNGSRMATY